MTEYLGYAAGSLTVMSFVPQVWKAWRTRSTRDLSWTMVVLLIVSGLMWLSYGMLTGDVPLIVTNAGMVSMNLGILAAKIRFAEPSRSDVAAVQSGQLH